MKLMQQSSSSLSKLSHPILRTVFTAVLVALLICPPGLHAQAASGDHVVSPQALQQQLQSSSASRQENVNTVTSFLSSPTADRAMRSAKLDPVQVRTAIPTLSDQELADLAARANNAQQQFAAGFLGPFSLTFLIVAIAVVIIVVAIWH